MLRRAVLGSGIAAAIIAAWLVLELPFERSWRITGLLLWLFIAAREWLLISRGHKQCDNIRIEHDGTIQLRSGNGCCSMATLCAGSIVLARFAWLRFETNDGRRCVELLRAKSTQNEDWRRLQVIWRHLGAGR
jgi:hypothetical protein